MTPQGSERLNRRSRPLQINLGASRLLTAYLLAVYGIALGVVVTSELPELAIGPIAVLLLIRGRLDIADSLCADKCARRLVLSAHHDWMVEKRTAAPARGRPLDAQFVHPWAVAFTLTDKDGSRTPVLVLPDMTDRKSFHALRLWLRQNSTAGVTGARI